MNYALIMISGIGKRLGEETPKQFLLVNKKPIYYYCLKTFYLNKNIDYIVLVTHSL